MTALKISLSYASKAYEVLANNHNLYRHLEQLASNVYELHPDYGGAMDEERLEYELVKCLISERIPKDEFWFD